MISLAIADLEKSVRLAGSFNAADRDLALAYHLAGRDHEALSMVDKAIAANRYDCRSYRIRAQIYESLGQREAAIIDYREVLELKGIDEDVKIAQDALHRLGSE